MLKYGTVRFSGAKAGDSVRFVESNVPGDTGAILFPNFSHEINAVLIKVDGKLGVVEMKQLKSSSASASGEAASAGGVRISLPVTAGGLLKIS